MAAIISLGFILSAIGLLTGFVPVKISTDTVEEVSDAAQPIYDEEALQTVKPQPDNLALYFASLDPNCELNPETMMYIGHGFTKMWVDPNCFTENSFSYLLQYLDIPLQQLMQELEPQSQDDKPTLESSSSSEESVEVQLDPIPTKDETPTVPNPKIYLIRGQYNHL